MGRPGKTSISDKIRLLPVEIDGDWTAADFATLFAALGDLYASFFVLTGQLSALDMPEAYGFRNIYTDLWEHYTVLWSTRGPDDVPPTADIIGLLVAARLRRLTVRKVEFASPGFALFEGLGSVLEQVRELIRDVIYGRNRQLKESGELDLEMKALEVVRMRLEVLQSADGFVRDDARIPPGAAASRMVRATRELCELAERGQLTSVGELEERR